MGQPLKRVQMLIEPEQHDALVRHASREGRSVAQMTRYILDLGLEAAARQEVTNTRSAALRRAAELRSAQQRRLPGAIPDIDVAGDISAMRSERDEELSGHRR